MTAGPGLVRNLRDEERERVDARFRTTLAGKADELLEEQDVRVFWCHE